MSTSAAQDTGAGHAEEPEARRAAARRVRGMFARADGRCLSEELIAERREQARRESAEATHR